MVFKGLNGSVSIAENWVTISREKKLDGVFHTLGSIIIPIRELDKVVYSKGGILNGFIVFIKKGDRQPHSVFSAIKNKNAIIFRASKNEQAKEVEKYTNALIATNT